MTKKRWNAGAALVLGATAAACAAGSGGSSGCSASLSPSPNSLAEVLDSAALQGRIAEVWPAHSGRVVARVGGRSEGVADSARVWAATLDDQQRAQVRAALMSSEAHGGEEVVSVFVGDEDGPALRRVDRLRGCAPSMIHRDALTERISIEAQGLDIRSPMTVRVLVFVERTGIVEEVRIDESSGDRAVDLAAARVFRGITFRPAQMAGIPVPVWAAFPVNFSPRRPGG